MSLTRLWHTLPSQGKGAEARQSLSEIYDWFFEEFETPNSGEDKALLDALALGCTSAKRLLRDTVGRLH